MCDSSSPIFFIRMTYNLHNAFICSVMCDISSSIVFLIAGTRHFHIYDSLSSIFFIHTTCHWHDEFICSVVCDSSSPFFLNSRDKTLSCMWVVITNFFSVTWLIHIHLSNYYLNQSTSSFILHTSYVVHTRHHPFLFNSRDKTLWRYHMCDASSPNLFPWHDPSTVIYPST